MTVQAGLEHVITVHDDVMRLAAREYYAILGDWVGKFVKLNSHYF